MEMKGKIRRCSSLVVFAGLLVFAIQSAHGGEAARISGSYQVVGKTGLGPQTRVQLQIHLTNHGQQELHIQRLTLWDFSHPEKGGTQPCAIVVHAGASADTTQAFTIPHAEYELWSRGTRPRLVVEVQWAGGRTTTQVVRLDRTSTGKVN